MLSTVIAVIVLVAAISLAVGYIVKQKKKGVKCIGCPQAGGCSKGCGCSSDEGHC